MQDLRYVRKHLCKNSSFKGSISVSVLCEKKKLLRLEMHSNYLYIVIVNRFLQYKQIHADQHVIISVFILRNNWFLTKRTFVLLNSNIQAFFFLKIIYLGVKGNLYIRAHYIRCGTVSYNIYFIKLTLGKYGRI